MRTEIALEFFGVNKVGLARILGVSKQSITKWGDEIPELYARRLRDCVLLTLAGGSLKARGKAA